MSGRRGKDLEQLMELLYRIETAADGTRVAIEKIECPGYVEDKETGSRREFDVLASGELGGMPFRLAIECKDWASPVDAPVVEGFIAKCMGTNIPLRMVVSSSGFTRPALTKAAANGIQCRTVAEVERPDWLAIDHIKYIERTATSFHIFCRTANDVSVENRVRVVDREGNELTPAGQTNVANAALREASSTIDSVGQHQVVVQYADPGWSVEKVDGTREAVLEVNVTVNFAVAEHTVSIKSFQEEVHAKAAPLTRAVADLAIGQLVISEQADGSKTVVFVPKRVG